jgi:hypothetical protein
MSVEGTVPGMKVMLDPSEHEDLTPEELETTYEIDRVKGEFATTKDAAGVVLTYRRLPWAPRWSRKFLPARAVVKPGKAPRVVSSDAEEKVQMTATQNIINLANQLGGKREHYIEAGRRLQADVTAYQEQFRSPSSVPVSLSSRSSENEVRAELERVKRERGCTYAEAGEVILCNAGAVKFEARVVQLRASGLDAKTALDRAQQEDAAGAEHYRASKLL